MPTFEFFLDSRGPITKDLEIDVTATLPKVTVQLFDGDTAVNLTGATVTFTLRDAQGTAVVLDAAATLLDATNGIVEYQLADADVDDVGFFFAQFTITISGESYLIPNDSTQRLRLRIGKEDVPAFSSVPASLPVHAGTHNLGGSDQIALEALLAQDAGVVWVDGERTDSYTEDGSTARPFKKAEAGIAASFAGRVGTDPPLRHTVMLLPSAYVVPTASLPIPLTDRIFIIGLNVEGTIVRAETGIDKDIFEINHTGPFSSNYEFHNLFLGPQKTLRAGIHIKSAVSRCRLFNCWVQSPVGESGAFAVKVTHPSGTVRVIIAQMNLWSELFQDFDVDTGVEFNFQDAGDCLAIFGSNLAEIKTNATAVAADIRLSNCRVGHEQITGGEKTQKIFAANCWTDDGDSTLAPLDALDFQGEHTFKIQG